MSLSGKLSTFPINSILQLMSEEQKTGVLRVTREALEAKVYFKDGSVIYATGLRKENRLGSLLVNNNVITEAQLNESLAAAKAQKKGLGKVLVERNFVSESTLVEYINRQTEDIIYGLLFWDSGEFHYKDANLNLSGLVTARLNVVKLLLESSRRIDELAFLRQHIPNDQCLFKISRKNQDQSEIKLSSSEWKLLQLLDGVRTVEQLMDLTGLDTLTVYKSLHSMLAAGLIEHCEEKRASTTEIVEDYTVIVTVYNDILQAICRLLETEIGKQMFTIFDECKPVVLSQPKDLYRDFHPNNATATNIHVICQAMSAVKDYEAGRKILVESFNEFITNILNRIPDLLGGPLTEKLLREIEEILSYVDTYQSESVEKSSIILEIRAILAASRRHLEKRVQTPQKTGGLLGRFTRN